MSDINNRGVSTPPVPGTPTAAQSESTVHVIDTEMYGIQHNPRGYNRVCVVDKANEADKPLDSNVNDSTVGY